MEIKVIRRENPRWSIARLHHYVHRDKTDLEVVQELMAMEVIGDECRDVFRKRWEAHELSKKPKPVEIWVPFKVVNKYHETARIVSLELESQEHVENASEVPVNSYAPIRLPNGLKRAYSIVSGKTNRFTLGVARDDNSRGGSTFIHEKLQVHDTVHIGEMKCSMEPIGMASHIICIVGGIGITAFLAMMRRRKTTNQTFELHYAVRSKEEVAFRSRLSELGESVRIYSKANGQRMDIDAILKNQIWNSQAFVCGPQRMIDSTIAAGAAAGMSQDEIYYETFSAESISYALEKKSLCEHVVDGNEVFNSQGKMESARKVKEVNSQLPRLFYSWNSVNLGPHTHRPQVKLPGSLFHFTAFAIICSQRRDNIVGQTSSGL